MGLYAAVFDFGCLKIIIGLESNRQAKQAAFARWQHRSETEGKTLQEGDAVTAVGKHRLASLGCLAVVLFNTSVKTDKQMLKFPSQGYK